MAASTKSSPLSRSSIESAHQAIGQHVHLTPVLTCQTLNDLASTPQSPAALLGTPYEKQRPAQPKINFFFKCENYQRVGAFKIRGATYALLRLSAEELAKGVVTNSSGNHAQALALAARKLDVTATLSCPPYPLRARSPQRKVMVQRSLSAVVPLRNVKL